MLNIEIPNSVRKIEKIYQNEKIKEYKQLDDCLQKFLDTFCIKKCELDFTVADIHFAFDNAQLIKLMGKRGKLIAQGNCSNCDQLDKQIQELIENKEQREKMNTILSAYITFLF